MFVTILIFLLILTVLVLIHEAGHFFVAKKLGIKVEEFGFGLPPRIFGIKKGETIYSINLLPVGGFVKLYGEDKVESDKLNLSTNNKNLGRAFFARPVWQRGLVVIAGVVMNFLLGTLIITYFFGVTGVQMPGDKVIVNQVLKSSPAEKAGLKNGDIIKSVNNFKITSPQKLIDTTKNHLGEQLTLEIQTQNGQEKKIKVIPRKVYPKNEGPMGIEISSNIITKKYPLYQAPFIGLLEAFKQSLLIISGLIMVFYQFVFQAQVPRGVAGPVGIAQLTGHFIQYGPQAVLSLISLLSLNLAILNILPIPALDGGRLFFILVEGIIGRKVPQKYETYAHAVGMAILLILIAFITLNDIIRLISGQSILPKP